MPSNTDERQWRSLYNTARWRALRLVYLMEHPLCERCLVSDIVEPATVVHHRQAHKGNLDLFFDPSNLEGLCKPHHDSHGQLEDHGKTPIQFDASGWPI